MTQNPFTAVFDAQRTALEQSQSFAHDALDAQQTSIGVMADAIETSSSMVESNAEMTKGTMHAFFDAVEMSMPEDAADFDELRNLIDESVDSATEAQSQSINAMIDAFEESEVAYEEFAKSYTEVIDTSFDAALEAHEQIEENMSAVAENVEAATDEFDTSA